MNKEANKMKVANHCEEKIKTERQWNELGFRLLERSSGERMWTNQFCQHISTYYREDEVEKMTAEEFANWENADRKQKNERAKELRKIRAEKQRKLEEKLKQEELAREQEWQKWRETAATKVEELKTGPNRLAAVAIEGYGTYFYEVPVGTEPKTQGIFPFGEMDVPVPGRVRWIVPEEDLEKIAKEEWFPYGLKKQIDAL